MRRLAMKTLSILGSTGSIGRSALDVVAAFPDRFRVAALAAGRSIEKLAEQVAAHRPDLVAIDRAEDVSRLERLLPAGANCRIVAGIDGLNEAACHPKADIVVGGLVGALGLRSAHAAVRAGKRLALANKEPLVVAGELILAEARKSGAELVPVDSEHSAIHQAMRSGRPEEARRLVLTASGGPFRERRLETFDAITVEDALAHPTWKMGPKITIDSATMMNKGLEVIEAHFLFGLPGERIDVVIHPQSLVHSFVEFVDGSLVAQLARNDMKFPIVYALDYPGALRQRLRPPRPRGARAARLLRARAAALPGAAVSPARPSPAGEGMPAVLNAANEVAVAAFLEGKISFPDIVHVVSGTMERVGRPAAPRSLDEAEAVDRTAREAASGIVRRRSPGHRPINRSRSPLADPEQRLRPHRRAVGARRRARVRALRRRQVLRFPRRGLLGGLRQAALREEVARHGLPGVRDPARRVRARHRPRARRVDGHRGHVAGGAARSASAGSAPSFCSPGPR